jgi:hypothetical protein
MLAPDARLCQLIFAIASDLLRSRPALEAEILVLWQQSMCCDALILRDLDLFRLTGWYWEASADCFPRHMAHLQSSDRRP